MSARTLRAEARAWRRAAEVIDAGEFAGLFMVVDRLAVDGLARSAMCERRGAHYAAADEALNGGHFTHAGGDGCNDLVLACLFLALECEDEAKEAT